MARAHDCDPRLSDRIRISAHIKIEGRIVDLLQRCGVGGIIQANDGNSSRRAHVGPRRGVRARASHCKARLSLGLGQTARASGPSTSSDSRTLTSAKNHVKVTRHTVLLKSNTVPHETPSYFRDFLP